MPKLMPDSEFHWEQNDDRLVIRAPQARITFVRAAGRWTHHLAFGLRDEAGDSEALVSATETPAEHDDPSRVVSPVYQELHRHEFSGGPSRGACVLLTGTLFTHHFSAVVSLHRDADQPSFVVLDFDIADRCRAEVSSLSATYLVRLGSSELVEASPERITWGESAELTVARLELYGPPPSRLALAEAGRTATRAQALAAIEPGGFTHRLRYCWRWETEEASDRTR
jgi:hypothetical protein